MRLPLPKKAVDALINHAMKTPYFHLEGYMNRYWILPYRKMRKSKASRILFGDIASRVHHILRSDDDRAFHSHPWSFITIILRGGYWEMKPVFDHGGFYMGYTKTWYGAGSIRFCSSKALHRLEVPEGQTAWTWFTTFRWKHDWGFLSNPANMVPYKKYLGIPESTQPNDSTKAQRRRKKAWWLRPIKNGEFIPYSYETGEHLHVR